MRRKEHFWSLYHLDERKQLDDLRTDQVETVFAAIAEAARPRWLVWKEGFVGWKPFEEFPSLLQGLRKAPAAGSVDEEPKAPAPPTMTGAELERERDRTVIEEFDGKKKLELDDRAPGRGASPGRRVDGGRRYAGGFDVEVVGQGRFKTRSVNASLTGMHLRDPLPQWAHRYFTLIVYGPDGSSIALLCTAVFVPGEAAPTRLKIEANDHENLFRTWLIQL